MALMSPLSREHGLGAAEQRVLALAATGMTTDQVAGHLGLDAEIVRHYTARAMQALGARSKLEAVVTALEQGLIDLPQPQ